jgi:hypothetical protein
MGCNAPQVGDAERSEYCLLAVMGCRSFTIKLFGRSIIKTHNLYYE